MQVHDRCNGKVFAIFVAIFGAACFPWTAGFAQSKGPGGASLPNISGLPVKANLNITPKRLTFKRGERSGTVYIYNQGTAPAVFDISIGDSVMLPSGEIQSLKEAQARPEFANVVGRFRSAKDLLVVAPRRAVLAPGKGQTVRVRVTAPAASDAPEYRAHLTVTTVPPREVGTTAEEVAAAQGTNRLTFRITSVFGISIPIIVRPGPADVRARISDVKLTLTGPSSPATGPSQRMPTMTFFLERSGANSLFGNVEIRSMKSKGLLGVARGVGVYPEIDKRLINVPLQRLPARGEALEITFVDDDVFPGRVITKAAFTAL